MHLQTYIFVPIHTHATLCIQNTTCFGLAILKCNMNLSLPHPAVTPAQSCFPSGPSPSCSWGSELCNRAPQILSFSAEFLSGLDLFLEHGSQAVRKGCLLSGTLLALNLRSLVFYDQSPSWLEERRMAEGHPSHLSITFRCLNGCDELWSHLCLPPRTFSASREMSLH